MAINLCAVGFRLPFSCHHNRRITCQNLTSCYDLQGANATFSGRKVSVRGSESRSAARFVVRADGGQLAKVRMKTSRIINI